MKLNLSPAELERRLEAVLFAFFLAVMTGFFAVMSVIAHEGKGVVEFAAIALAASTVLFVVVQMVRE